MLDYNLDYNCVMLGVKLITCLGVMFGIWFAEPRSRSDHQVKEF